MSLHEAPDLGVGEGVPVQHVSDPRAPPGDQQERQPDRQAGQDLVSEPQDETEENEQGKPHPRTHLKSHLFVSAHVGAVSRSFSSPLSLNLMRQHRTFNFNFNETVTLFARFITSCGVVYLFVICRVTILVLNYWRSGLIQHIYVGDLLRGKSYSTSVVKAHLLLCCAAFVLQ